MNHRPLKGMKSFLFGVVLMFVSLPMVVYGETYFGDLPTGLMEMKDVR